VKDDLGKRFIVRLTITADELRGLGLLADSLGEHLREGLGTGDEAGDRSARAAAAWVGRASSYAYAHPQRRRRSRR
jgi:hypothetical protein